MKVRTSYMGKNKSNSDGDIKRRRSKNDMVACKKGSKEREAAGKSQFTKPCSRSRCPFPIRALRSALKKTLLSCTALAGPPWM